MFNKCIGFIVLSCVVAGIVPAWAENRVVPSEHPSIQAAIDAAQNGDVILVAPGIYQENLLLSGKDIVLRSYDPCDMDSIQIDPNLTAMTVLTGDGSAPVVTLQDCSESCRLVGFTLRGGGVGLRCEGINPIIRGCHILENLGAGVEIQGTSYLILKNCIIADNNGYGLETVTTPPRGATPPSLINCTITQNYGGGVSDKAKLRNCIVTQNGPTVDTDQLARRGVQATYCCIQGGYSGQDNIDTDPLFVCPGHWSDFPEMNDIDPVWIAGDYHLRSQAGCWDPNRMIWVQDTSVSPCIDAGYPSDDESLEPAVNGNRINMGAYGGTPQASRSVGLQLTASDQSLDQQIGSSAVSADFDEDGHLDVFVLSQDPWQGRGSRLYLGDGQGHFTDSGQSQLSSFTDGAVAVLCDSNGDGHWDVRVGSTIWTNDGQGHLSRSSVSQDGELIDLNKDGYLDVVNQVSGGFQVYLNDGEGHYHVTGSIFAQSNMGITFGDLTGDGFPDAITKGWRDNGSQANPNWVLFNDGQGNLIDSGQRLDEGVAHVHGVALEDMDGNGSLDLAMALCNSTRGLAARIFLNDGEGHLSLAQSIPGSQAHGVALADFTGDGVKDLYISIGIVSADSPDLIWFNNGQGQFHDSGLRLGIGYTGGLALGDYNEDGKFDVFLSHLYYPTAFTIRGVAPELWLNTTPALPEVVR